MLKIISKIFNALFSGKMSQHGAEEHLRSGTWTWWRCEGGQEN